MMAALARLLLVVAILATAALPHAARPAGVPATAPDTAPATPRDALHPIPAASSSALVSRTGAMRLGAPRSRHGASPVSHSPRNRAVAAAEASPSTTARPSSTHTRPRTALRASTTLSGQASWYCLPGRSACTVGVSPSCLCAAGGPAIRAALGSGWRGHIVSVETGRTAVAVRLVDFCSCPDGRLLDLFGAAFSQLAPHGLSDGLMDVRVTW